jgi:ATP-dependent Clp protease ATP-binding subunit ClpC
MAFEECQRMGQGHVGTHHLLLGLLIEEDALAAKTLGNMGVTLDQARAEINRLLEEGVNEESSTPPSPRREAGTKPRSPELRQLLRRAQLLATKKGSSTTEPDHLLEAIASSAYGLEVLSRLVDVQRIAGLKEEVIAADDYEAAARHRTDERSLRGPLEQALSAWRAHLASPQQSEGTT